MYFAKKLFLRIAISHICLYGAQGIIESIKYITHKIYQNNASKTQGLRTTHVSNSRFSTVWGDYAPTFRTCRNLAAALEGVCPVRRRRETGWGNPVDTYMHNRVHAIFRGSFSDTVTSPNDPLFICHHAQVDRLFEKWLRRRPRRRRRRRRRRRNNRRRARLQYSRQLGRPTRMDLVGHCGLCYTVGFIPVIRNVQLLNNVRRFGYEYDSYRFGRVP